MTCISNLDMASFYVAHKLRMIFTFLGVKKKRRKELYDNDCM